MPSLAPFTPGASSTLSATTSTGRVALTRNGSDQVLIFAPAANAAAFIKFGDSTVVAAVTDIPIGPGFSRVFTVPKGATHVAGITGASTATLYFTCGDGQ